MEKISRIQISPTKRVQDAFTIWFEETPDTDLVIESIFSLEGMFKSGSIKTIYEFSALKDIYPNNLLHSVKVLFDLLAPEGELYIIENDFSYLCRSIVSGDLKVQEFNEQFIGSSYITPEFLTKLMVGSGFKGEDLREWYQPQGFDQKHFEFILSGKKPKAINI